MPRHLIASPAATFPPKGRRAFLAQALAWPLLIAAARPALAGATGFYANGGGAIAGYDPVAYFTEGRAVKGTLGYALRWRAANWYFANQSNLDAFEMNPDAFAPQYGGFCAYAMTMAKLVPTDPEAFTLHQGRLYLTENLVVRDLWRRDITGYIVLADGNWPKVAPR